MGGGPGGRGVAGDGVRGQSGLGWGGWGCGSQRWGVTNDGAQVAGDRGRSPATKKIVVRKGKMR
ncbi:hypothetical protein TIFTF001_038559 [Ficus carica]|uniref:Uncharacterized protein n=1 Tax=Ficus carica TaxID=3494 RepID=A0AA88E8B8_FICCA|nr:hypothetical protein TIFTF001_038559 [Ficus carica]